MQKQENKADMRHFSRQAQFLEILQYPSTIKINLYD